MGGGGGKQQARVLAGQLDIALQTGGLGSSSSIRGSAEHCLRVTPDMTRYDPKHKATPLPRKTKQNVVPDVTRSSIGDELWLPQPFLTLAQEEFQE